MFGVVLGVLATVVLLVWVNALSAGLALLAEAFYLVVYTMLLKRRTTQNIVWGGLAGCFPALIGWTAVTGSLSWVPVVLFLVVFFWTPPHTWALALRYREDYAGVDVPMLPVVAPAAEVGRQIVLYSVAMVATSLLLWPVASTGWLYPVAASVLGAVFLVQAVLMWRRSIGTEELSRDPADGAVPLLQPLPVAALRRRRARPARHPLRRGSAVSEGRSARETTLAHRCRLTRGQRCVGCPSPLEPTLSHRSRLAGSRTDSSTQVTAAETRAAPSMWKPTRTMGRSVKYWTKPIVALGHDHRAAAPRAGGWAGRASAR